MRGEAFNLDFLNSHPRQKALLASVSDPRFRVAVKNAKGDEPAEALVYGDIGDGYMSSYDEDSGAYTILDAHSMTHFLAENAGQPVHVRINSPGGLAYDGITMHNALLAHDGPVTTTIEGQAASAASVIAVAGSPVRMFENATLMIHRAMCLAIGNRDMMADTMDFLDKLDDQIARTYGGKAGKPRAQYLNLMKGKLDGTYMNAEEAKKYGLVDEILGVGTPDREQQGQNILRQEKIRLRTQAEPALHSVQAARARRVRERRDELSLSAGETGSAGQTGVKNVVPPNPPNGSGEGVAGTWSAPSLADFTEKSFADLTDAEKKTIATHFAYYPNADLDDFGDLKLPHHFAPNHANSGKPSLDGVRNALARLDQVQGMSAEDRDAAKRHLEAHMPKK